MVPSALGSNKFKNKINVRFSFLRLKGRDVKQFNDMMKNRFNLNATQFRPELRKKFFLLKQDSFLKGAKYLGVFSSRSLKLREKCISFAQFVYFLRELWLLFNFWMIKFTTMFFCESGFFLHNCESYHSKNWKVNKIPSKNIQTEQN